MLERLVADAAVGNEDDVGRVVAGGGEGEKAGGADVGTVGDGGAIWVIVLVIGEENGPVGIFEFAGREVFDANFFVIKDGKEGKVFGTGENDGDEELIALDEKIGGSGVDTQFDDGGDGFGFAVALDGEFDGDGLVLGVCGEECQE